MLRNLDQRLDVVRAQAANDRVGEAIGIIEYRENGFAYSRRGLICMLALDLLFCPMGPPWLSARCLRRFGRSDRLAGGLGSGDGLNKL